MPVWHGGLGGGLSLASVVSLASALDPTATVNAVGGASCPCYYLEIALLGGCLRVILALACLAIGFSSGSACEFARLLFFLRRLSSALEEALRADSLRRVVSCINKSQTSNSPTW